MWWGGSEGGHGRSPPPDPPKEDVGVASGEEPEIAVVQQELGDLKDQFDQQQALIGHLKTMLKKKEATLTTREKEVEDYATRLAKMKPRLGRGGRVRPSSLAAKQQQTAELSKSSKKPDSASVDVLPEAGGTSDVGELQETTVTQVAGDGAGPSPHPSEEETINPPPPPGEVVRVVEEKRLSSSESGSRAKILLLRKQLQENRAKFQKQQQGDDKVVMEEMKQRIERLREEVEQRDYMIHELQDGKGASSEEISPQKLYQQIIHKDRTIVELSQKVNQLEGIIHDQQESLTEKDKIIEARTEAVSLIAKAQDEKNIKTLEELEEVRYQMKKMQQDFTVNEQEFIAEKDNLSKDLKDKLKKIAQLEESGRRIENLRFEMSARNAELQEKIVTLQSDAKTFKEHTEAEKKSYEEKDSLIQDLKQKLVRAEAHGQKKLKALEKQVRSMKHAGNAGEQILELQNSIAELEEEKGNLQLKLVDFDDLKTSMEKLTSVRSKLEDKVKQLNCDLDSQLSAITHLETEKIKLVEGINERENRIFDLESEISNVKANLEEVTQAKVTLDLRLCEVEEQRDTSEKLRTELENQMTESSGVPMDQLIVEKGNLEESVQSLIKEKDDWKLRYESQINSFQECEEKTKLALEEKEKKTKECKRLMNILTDRENAIATLSIQIDKHNVVVAGIEEKVSAGNSEIEKRQMEIDNLNQSLQDQLLKVTDCQKTIKDMENQSSSMLAQLQSKDKQLIEAQQNIESLNSSINERNITVQNLVGEVSSLQEQVQNKEKSLEGHIQRLEELEMHIKDRETNIDELCDTIRSREDDLSKKDLEIRAIKNDVQNITKQLETTKSSLESELDILSSMLSDSKSQLSTAQSNIDVKNKEIENNQIVISKYEQEVCDKNLAFDDMQQQYQDLHAKLLSCTTSLSEKESLLTKLQNDLEEKVVQIGNLEAHQSSLEQKLADQQNENKSLVDGKSLVEENLNEYILALQQKEEVISQLSNDKENFNASFNEREQQIVVLESNLESYKTQFENSSSEMERLHREITSLNEMIQNKTQELENIHLQSTAKDSTIVELQNQLQAVTDRCSQSEQQLVQSQEYMVGLQNQISESSQQLMQVQQQYSESSQQLMQVQEQYSESSQQLMQVQEQYSESSQQLMQVQEQYSKLQEEFDINKTQHQDTMSQYEKVTDLATRLEEQLRMKASSLEQLEVQMTSQGENQTKELADVHNQTQALTLEITKLETELKDAKQQVETSQAEILSMQQSYQQVQGSHENMKSLVEATQTECQTAKQNLELKCAEILQWQESLSEHQSKISSLEAELNQALSYQQQYQQHANSLQEELNRTLNMKQQSDNEVVALSATQQQRIAQLEGELLNVNQAKDLLQIEYDKNILELQNQNDKANQLRNELISSSQTRDNLLAEIETTRMELQTQVDLVNELQNKVGNLTSETTSKDSNMEALQNKIVEMQKSEEHLNAVLLQGEEEKNKLKDKVKELELSLSSNTATSADANVSDVDLLKMKEELSSMQDQNKFLEEECDGLRIDANAIKQQLQDARQTITHLQTSLATHSQNTNTNVTEWDSWGEVDLGTPPSQSSGEISFGNGNSLISSLQKSLADKDEMLTMMQEQFKDTLQEIKNMNEEKKIFEQTRKHDEMQLESLRQDLEKMQQNLEQEKEKVTTIELELQQKEELIKELNEQKQAMQSSEGTVYSVPTTSSNQGNSDSFTTNDWYQTNQGQDTSNWFDQMPEAKQSLSADVQISGTTDEASGFMPTSQLQESQEHVQDEAVGGQHIEYQQPQLQNTANWFDQSFNTQQMYGAHAEGVTTEQNSEAQNSSSQLDAANWFDQQHTGTEDPSTVEQAVTAQIYDQQQSSSSELAVTPQVYDHQQTSSSEVAQEDQGAINVEELQYKLTWYEEQWGTWTGHYNQLQTTYEESERRVAELLQELEQLQGDTAALNEKTVTKEISSDVTSQHDGESKGTEETHGSVYGQNSPTDEETQTVGISDSQVQELQHSLDNTETALEKLKEENKLLQEQANSYKENASAIEGTQYVGLSDTQIQEMQDRLNNTEAAFEQLKEENQSLQKQVYNFQELQLQSQATNQDPLRLQEAEAEINHLRGFETQVYELQSQVQAYQHQCTAMQNKLAEAETEVSRLRDVEALYGELQSCIQESETKREGSKSRVQELELMVQSAESEIDRLRKQINELNQSEQAAELSREKLQEDAEQRQRLEEELGELSTQLLKIQKEADTYKEEISMYKTDIAKYQNEVDCCKAEIERLRDENQSYNSEMTSVGSNLQRNEQENSQLRSELEVLEGELDRMRNTCEIFESENTRAQGDFEALSQASQMLEAEKESLESEVQRLTAQSMTYSTETERLRDEIQRLTEVNTSAETEIARLQMEMERFQTLDLQYTQLETQYNELQNHLTSLESTGHRRSKESESDAINVEVEEVDWGAEAKIEVAHIQRSSSVDLKYQEEIDDLKKKIIAIEKERNDLYDEVQATKLKSGKMLQKWKIAQNKNDALTKEMQKLKAKAGGFSDLDQALEEEWKAQVTKAESERDEVKQKLDEVENEKDKLLTQVDVLTAAQEEYFELKESQDTTIKLLKSHNKEVESQVQALEWKISELEEMVAQQQGSSGGVVEETIIEAKSQKSESAPLISEQHQKSSEMTDPSINTLKETITSCKEEVKLLKSENERLKISNKELGETVERLNEENEKFQSIIENLKVAKDKAEGDTYNYKTVYIELHDEHESLKREKDKTNEQLRELIYKHDTLKAAYDSLYVDFNDVRDVADSYKHDLGIIQGERERLVEEINSLNNQLEALKEEEEEETIRALQDECASLREQISLLHEENTSLEVKARESVDKATRTESTLEQNVEMQKLLQEEIMRKTEALDFNSSTIEGQERQISYLKAEIAALKSKLAQQDQAEESTLEAVTEYEKQIEQLQEQNQQLALQVETAEASLNKLAGASKESGGAIAIQANSAELEAALASLHLRDLRCQQLSLEITKLLEERDALQLKLSASLRQTQELTRELSLSHQLPPPVNPEPNLDEKLAELRELNDSLEQRALESLKGAAATLGRRVAVGGLQSPPIFTQPHTAPATPTATRHADYTLSREAQGTSSTLIDWIMGKSTPKVLHV